MRLHGLPGRGLAMSKPQFQGRYGLQYGDPGQPVLETGQKNRCVFRWRPGWPNVVINLWKGHRQASVLVKNEEFLCMSSEIAKAIESGVTEPIREEASDE